MEPVFHYILPVLILLLLFPFLRNKIGIKKLLLLGLLAILPDFDIFIFGTHRFLFHNIFFVLIIFLIFYFGFGRLYGFLALYFTSSHLLFDLSKPGIAFLYPFTKKLIYLDIVVGNTYKWLLKIEFGFLGFGAVDPFYPQNYLQPWGALTLILIVFLFGIKFVIGRR